MKLAILGYGKVARGTHAPAWKSRIDVVAIADPDAGRRAEAAADFPAARVVERWEEALDGADVVDICTPPVFHAPQIREAARRKLPVLCEKPLVTTIGEFDSIPESAMVSCVANWAKAPAVSKVRELIGDGAVGAVKSVLWQAIRKQSDPGAGKSWRTDPKIAGGGILFDHGWHALSVLRSWMAWRPASLQAKLDGEPEHTARVAIQTARAQAEIVLTWAGPERSNTAHVVGERGAIELDDDEVVLRRPGAAPESTKFAEALSARSEHPEWFGPVADEFLGDVAAGRSRLAEAGEILRVILLAYQSKGRRVEL